MSGRYDDSSITAVTVLEAGPDTYRLIAKDQSGELMHFALGISRNPEAIASAPRWAVIGYDVSDGYTNDRTHHTGNFVECDEWLSDYLGKIIRLYDKEG